MLPWIYRDRAVNRTWLHAFLGRFLYQILWILGAGAVLFSIGESERDTGRKKRDILSETSRQEKEDQEYSMAMLDVAMDTFSAFM